MPCGGGLPLCGRDCPAILGWGGPPGTVGSSLAGKQAGSPVQPMDAKLYAAIMLYTGNAIYRDLNQVRRPLPFPFGVALAACLLHVMVLWPAGPAG